MKLAFPNSYNYLTSKYQENPNATLRLPDDVKEYFILNSTSMPGVFEIQSIRYYDFVQVRKELSLIEETSFESLTDITAGYQITESMQKIRRLDRSIGDSLKQLYDYRCQITGEKIGNNYGDVVIEAHHIEFFTTSLNNDSSNIIIISPNFHRIIHKNLPIFDREHLEFHFQNGVVEKIRLDKHLRQQGLK
ncbi:MAG: hypothetical protein KBS95_07380 [Alistipes sp.]|nr:hypothetical protein [Candidatus Alistipes equi]